jgi:hypothetical protein
MSWRSLTVLLLVLLLIAAACASDGEVAEVASLEETSASTATDEPDSAGTTTGSTADDAATPTADEEFSTPLEDEERREGIPNSPSDYVIGFYGDSVARSIEEKLTTFLDWGLRMRMISRAFPGSATCAFQPDLERDAASGVMWGAVLLYSNNVFPECMWDENGDPLEGEPKWEKFEADMRLAVDTLVAEEIRVYLPTLALTRTEVDDERPASQRVNELIAKLAGEHELVFLIDAAPSVLGPSGDYVEYLPCFEYEPCLNGTDDDGTPVNLVRQFDGAHFCTGGYEDYEAQEGLCPAWASGQLRYGLAVAQRIIEDAYAEFAGDG